jgi:hypothetical protein
MYTIFLKNFDIIFFVYFLLVIVNNYLMEKNVFPKEAEIRSERALKLFPVCLVEEIEEKNEKKKCIFTENFI